MFVQHDRRNGPNIRPTLGNISVHGLPDTFKCNSLKPRTAFPSESICLCLFVNQAVYSLSLCLLPCKEV